MVEVTKIKAGLALLTFACTLVAVSCGSSPNVACATTDVPLVRDVAAATRAVEVASAAIGMDGVPTETAQREFQEGATNLSLDTGGDLWVLTRVSRSELVDFVDLRPAVAALEDEGFEQERTTDPAAPTYNLKRGDQRASVSLGPRLREYYGKVEARVQVDTGCRPA